MKTTRDTGRVVASRTTLLFREQTVSLVNLLNRREPSSKLEMRSVLMNQTIALLKSLVHWLLLAVIIIYLITGLGITQYHIIETITFGLLNKNLSFRIHDSLLIPFIVLLIFHVILVLIDHKTNLH